MLNGVFMLECCLIMLNNETFETFLCVLFTLIFVANLRASERSSDINRDYTHTHTRKVTADLDLIAVILYSFIMLYCFNPEKRVHILTLLKILQWFSKIK